MKKANSIFHLLLALFFGISLVFFLAFDNVKGIFGTEELTTKTVVSFLIVGLIIFLASLGFEYFQKSKLETKIQKIEAENIQLKAKLYDLDPKNQPQVIDKRSSESQTLPPSEEDKDGSGIRPRQNIK
ncbi:hypothetical protein [Pararhodonellum marinum]|uniref:hypothetical protein n=1 Tax=Pararhodonellum marinum TaxID=2755358 RepID=UPI00188F0CC2|nr:hypothetical protein [Pararhodonellum marinum]